MSEQEKKQIDGGPSDSETRPLLFPELENGTVDELYPETCETTDIAVPEEKDIFSTVHAKQILKSPSFKFKDEGRDSLAEGVTIGDSEDIRNRLASLLDAPTLRDVDFHDSKSGHVIINAMNNAMSE